MTTSTAAPATPIDIAAALEVAADSARDAGGYLREQFGEPLHVSEVKRFDIKLEIDVKTQDRITNRLLAAYPEHAIYGEEGVAGNSASEFQWIVDPLDGTVNYFYGIPHYCVSIALRRGQELLVGAIYDPMLDEMWTAAAGGPSLLNGKPCRVSRRASLGESVITVGFAKSESAMEAGLARYRTLASRVRKMRMMGSAALAMTYIACGRLDAYIESTISLWDIAAGKLIVEGAGGRVSLTPSPAHPDKFGIVASNGLLHDEFLD